LEYSIYHVLCLTNFLSFRQLTQNDLHVGGVGMSTRALAYAFQDADFICGIDTSPEMIGMARFIVTFQELQDAITGFKISGNFLSSISTFIKKIQLALLLPVKKVLPQSTSKAQNRSLFYALGNAERVKVAENSFDLVTIMYAFHEIPKTARYRILREAR
jgi:ubiquinone/menaquinone biosynthesis C-methylase UbiE